jgi:polyisoprenoid-binding protein YceI
MPTWLIDHARSHVGFSVKHMVVATIRGRFREFRGTIDLDPADFPHARISGEIDVASLDTDNRDRDAQLRSNDFLAIARFPHIRFTSGKIVPAGRGAFRVFGALTVRGVTRDVALDVGLVLGRPAANGAATLQLTAQGTLLRRDFGLELGPLLETAGLAIGDKVKLELDVRLTAAPPSA